MQVISTFQTAAELGSQSLGAYVISMANTASDVLAVELLQKEALLTVGNTRFISSKSSAQLNTVSPPAAQANSSASTQGQASAPSMVPSTVHGSRSGNLQATTSDTSTISGVLLAPEENFGAGVWGWEGGGGHLASGTGPCGQAAHGMMHYSHAALEMCRAKLWAPHRALHAGNTDRSQGAEYQGSIMCSASSEHKGLFVRPQQR